MDKKILEKELKGINNEIILLEVSSETLVEAGLTALKTLVDSGKVGIIVSASRPYNSLLDLYKKYKINTKDLIIIDAISHKQGLKTEEIGNIFFVENVKSLTTMSIMIKESMEKIKKSKFVLIDSVTTMLIYNNPETYMRFLHDILSEMRNQGTGGVLIFVQTESNESLNKSIIITKEMALQAMNESEQIIQNMLKNNFPILYMNDALIEAKKVFEQARYAEILNGFVNSSEQEKTEAQRALALINWKKISYADVLNYTEDIKQRKEKAFFLNDEITVEENKLNSSLKISNETKQILADAKTAFQEDRYQDAENLIETFRIAFEQENAQASSLLGIRGGAQGFFQRYWIYLIVILVTFGIAGYFAYKKFEKKLIKAKVRKMKIEEEVLMNLMKRAQEDRFKKNTISGLIYNIRMKKYQERLQEIKQELPVLESRI